MRKHLLYVLALGCMTAGVPAASAESVAHGYQLGDQNNLFGFISFPVSGFATPTLDKRNYGETHVSAGECVDGIYYTFEVYPDVMGGVTAYDYCIRDAKTFEVIKTIPFYSDAHRVVDMTYDYTTNTMYALVEDAESTGSIMLTSLNVVNLTTGECTVVGSPGELKAINGNGKEVDEALITLAADKEGTLYAMGEYRQFYTLDKLTGKATQIGGQHSIATTNQFQSMAFDGEGVLYWAQCHPDYGYFLTIDPATGVPSYMVEDPNPDTKWVNEGSKLGADAEVTGLWFEKELDTLAPAEIADLKAVIAEGNPNTVNLTWALPTVDLAGNEVTVTAVKVYRFGLSEAVATLPADATSYTDAAAPNGMQAYMVSAVAAEKHGRGAVVEVFAGADMLMPVSNLVAELSNATVTLTWNAPTDTENGGYADFDNITYRVWRICGDKEELIAQGVETTTYTDELTESGAYYYSVEPVSCGVVGYAKDSESVTYSKTASLPYFSGFEDEQDGQLWTFANNHTNTSYGWSIGLGYVYQRYDGKFAQLKSAGSNDPCNDYMFSPAIEFTPGTYTLNYMVNGSLSSDTHSWSVYLADGADAGAKVVADIESHNDEKVGGSWIASEGSTFTVTEGGVYYLVFHGTTTAMYCTLKIDNVSIAKAPASLPYACDFEEGSDAADWKIVNSNPHLARGAGWSMATEANSPSGRNVAKLYVYSVSDGEYDDWMISPAIYFPAAGTYTLTFGAKGASYDTHKWEACLGTDSDDLTSFTTPVVAYNKAKFGAWADYTAQFAVTEPGVYHLGLHGQGCDTATSLYLDNIRLSGDMSGIDDAICAEDAEPVAYYNLSGQRIEAPVSGLVIVRYSDGSVKKVYIR